ncbi:protein disulfide-isomerase, partial [Clonorchis sinensis]
MLELKTACNDGKIETLRTVVRMTSDDFSDEPFTNRVGFVLFLGFLQIFGDVRRVESNERRTRSRLLESLKGITIINKFTSLHTHRCVLLTNHRYVEMFYRLVFLSSVVQDGSCFVLWSTKFTLESDGFPDFLGISSHRWVILSLAEGHSRSTFDATILCRKLSKSTFFPAAIPTAETAVQIMTLFRCELRGLSVESGFSSGCKSHSEVRRGSSFRRTVGEAGNFSTRKAHLSGYICEEKREYISNGSTYSGHDESTPSRLSPRVYEQSRRRIRHSISASHFALFEVYLLILRQFRALERSPLIGPYWSTSTPWRPERCFDGLHYKKLGHTVAGRVRSKRHTGTDYVTISLEKEIQQEEITREMELETEKQKLASSKRMLLFYEAFDDESSVSDDCEPKVNPEESECVRPSPNLPGKDGASDIRTAAHEMNNIHFDHYATAPGITLQRNEVGKFSGNPMEVRKFMKAFQMSVADRLFDDSNKLMYHLHYCCWEAKEAVKHCVFLPGQAGYQKAMDIFRTPHDIAQSFMNELLGGGPIALRDIDILRRLIRKMVSCVLAVRQTQYTADLIYSTNLRRIVERLPRHLQQRWIEAADDIPHSGPGPDFDHLISFLHSSVSIASNCYGVIAISRRYANQVDKVGLGCPPRKARINVVTLKANMAFPNCLHTHNISDCQVSRYASIAWSLNIRRLSVAWLHIATSRTATNDIVCFTADGGEGYERCQRQLSGTWGTPELSWAHNSPAGWAKADCIITLMLDNGSDTTLLTTDVAKQLGIEKEATRVEVSSVNGPDIRDIMEVNFAIQSLLDGYVVDVDCASTIGSPLITKAVIPVDLSLSKWTHLADVQPVRIIGNDVSILIGTNVPKAHWVIEQRLGSLKHPYAYLTALGWDHFGPATPAETADAYHPNVHPFGATSFSLCVAFALRKVADDNRNVSEEETVSVVKENFYVDDCLVSVKSIDIAKKPPDVDFER